MGRRGRKPTKAITFPLSQEWSIAKRGLTRAARTAFTHYVELLRQKGALQSTDVELVIAAAMTVELRDIAYKQLSRDGIVQTSDRGNIVPHPAEKMHSAACLRLRALDAEMGLTPLSSKAAAPKEASNRGLDRFRTLAVGGDDS
jgi:P27 family predicted phage terminase small subunit